jgi:hypothetical protein
MLTVLSSVTVVVAESGARLCNFWLASLLALRSATLAARSSGTARSNRPRRTFCAAAEVEAAAEEEEEAAEEEEEEAVAEMVDASVDRAAAVTKVGVMVHVGSGQRCEGGIEQWAVLVIVLTKGTTVYAVFLSVAVFVTITVEIGGVIVTVGDF